MRAADYLEAAEEGMPLDEALQRLDELADTSDHFEFFWFPHTSVALTKRNTRLAEPPAVTRSPRRASVGALVENGVHGLFCRAGRWLPGQVPRLNRFLAGNAPPAHYADASYEVFTSIRRVRFVETEYAIPREAIRDALARVRRLTQTYGHDVTFPLEVRFAAADDIPLSTAFGRDTAYIAAHVYRGLYSNTQRTRQQQAHSLRLSLSEQGLPRKKGFSAPAPDRGSRPGPRLSIPARLLT